MGTPNALLALMPHLALHRPVFHSEADFQHALAWAIQRMHPEWRIRLETRPYPGFHLDLWIVDPLAQTSSAVELKYLTALWDGEIAGETFHLTSQGAQDIIAYDCVKDIGRVERLVADGYATSGLALTLTNDPSYWRDPQHGRPTNADAFRLYEGRVLAGTRAWGPRTGAGTMRSRTLPIELRGTYSIAWADYSRLPGARGTFRYLALAVDNDG